MPATKGLLIGLAVLGWLGRARAEPPARRAEASAVREMPCPDAPPRFDYTKIRRDLQGPRYGSGKPLYRFFALGPEGKTVIAMVADESGGTGTGVDTVYVDLNANGDITEAGERFAVPGPRPPARPAKTGRPDLVTASLGAWGRKVMAERKLDVPDPVLAYRMRIDCGIVFVVTTARDGSWRVPLRVMPDVPWSTSRRQGPVFRVGGDEFHLKNESFVEVRKGRGQSYRSGVGRKIRPGTTISVDGTTPFFAGSSPSAYSGWYYVEGGHPGLRAWLESTEDPAQPVVSEIILRGY